jgi:uncharacterized protein YaaW (UPF0174 family)
MTKVEKQNARTLRSTFKGSAKTVGTRVAAQVATRTTEVAAQVGARVLLRTISTAMRTAGIALGPVGIVLDIAATIYSMYEEGTAITEVSACT